MRGPAGVSNPAGLFFYEDRFRATVRIPAMIRAASDRYGSGTSPAPFEPGFQYIEVGLIRE